MSLDQMIRTAEAAKNTGADASTGNPATPMATQWNSRIGSR